MKNLPSIYNENYSMIQFEQKQLQLEEDQLVYKLLIKTNLIELFSKEHQETITHTVLDYTSKQKRAINSGILKLMEKKDGSLSAILVDSKTKKIVEHVPLKEVNIEKVDMKAINNLMINLKLNEIMGMLEELQIGIQDLLVGLHNDRLAKSKSIYSQYLMVEYITEEERKFLIPVLISNSSEAFFQLVETFQYDLSKLRQNNNANKLKEFKNYLSSQNQNLSDNIFIQLEAIVYSTMVRHMVYRLLDNKSLHNIPLNDLNMFLQQNINTEDLYLLNEWTNQNIDFWTDDYKEFISKLNSDIDQLEYKSKIYLE